MYNSMNNLETIVEANLATKVSIVLDNCSIILPMLFYILDTNLFLSCRNLYFKHRYFLTSFCLLQHIKNRVDQCRSGNCQEFVENIREFLPFNSGQGILREFYND